MNRLRLYTLTMLACMAGYAWLAYQMVVDTQQHPHAAGVCIIKNITHLPCPSCGSSRAVLELMHGHLLSALYWNPLGFLVMAIMIISPLWIGRDLVFHQDSFLQLYRRMENTLRLKWVFIPAALLILSNWIWNVIKGY